ncbi:hypothetical protein [Afipia clevelandensis]|uniref:Uncharacterized protein n=1 Tax=Afipia clevelandensis ATCC 49720 TaxID=883079 RepID=K8PE18_9BRAD|nr:hypothetical protein [Afipia clevelandensis]EKS37805.1 hypothetical protein HMPREF9696_01755 [Afipia clevelandensis ATCC 49720]
MSVQCNTYVLIGTSFPYDTFSEDDMYEKLEPFMDNPFKGIHHHNGICILSDGMNGEYFIVGRVLAKSANHDGLVAPLVVRMTDAERSEVKYDIKHALGSLVTLPDFDVTPIVVSHYR